MNAEVINYKKDWKNVKKVGISQGREQEKAAALKKYPQIESFKEVTQKGILYTLEDGQIDAVIQDITKAAAFPEYLSKPLASEDFISYVLVVDKEFTKTEAFSDFLESYNQAVEKLNKSEYLAQKLGVSEEWLDDKAIEFLPLGY